MAATGLQNLTVLRCAQYKLPATVLLSILPVYALEGYHTQEPESVRGA